MKKLILLGVFALSLTVNAGYLEDGNLYYKNQKYQNCMGILKIVEEIF